MANDRTYLGIGVGAYLQDSFGSTFQTAKDEASQLGKVFKENDKKIATLKSFSKYKDKLAPLKDKQQELTKTSNNLTKEIKKVEKQFSSTSNEIYSKQLEKLRQKQSKVQNQSKRLSQVIKGTEKRFNGARRTLKRYGIGLKNVANQEKILIAKQEQIEARRKRLDVAEKARQNVMSRKGELIGVIGAAYAATKLIQKGAEFEENQIFLETVINADDVGGAVKLARKQAIEFAQTGLSTKDEILELNYALNSAGLDAETSRLGSEVVAKVAKITRGDAGQVGEVIATAFNNMGDDMVGTKLEKLQRIGDVLTKTQFKFQIRDFGQLGESFKQGAKAAIKYKVDLEQTAAVLGQFNNTGMQGATAGTAFNAVLRQMGKASEDLGFELVRDDDDNMDLMSTLDNLKASLSEIEDFDERASTLQTIFGDEGSGVALLLKDLDKMKENYRAVKDESKGLVDKSYAKFLNSTSGQMKIFTNNMDIAGTTLAGVFLPAVNLALTPLIGMFKVVTYLNEEFPIIASMIAGAGAAFLTYKAVVLGAAVAQWAYTAAVVAMASPVGLIIAGVGALGAGLYYVYKNWDTVSDARGRFFDTVMDYSPVLKGALSAIFSPIDTAIEAWDTFKGMLGFGKVEPERPSEIGDVLAKSNNTVIDQVTKTIIAEPKLLQRATFDPVQKNGLTAVTKSENSLSSEANVRRVINETQNIQRANNIKMQNINTFNIVANPGDDEEKIAAMVVAKMEENERRKMDEISGVLFDSE